MRCDVYWGSHGCHRPSDHVGDHVCAEDGEECCRISNSGYDPNGFRWDMYGRDSPEEFAEYLDLVYQAGNILPGGRIRP